MKSTLLHNLHAALASFKEEEELYGPNTNTDDQYSAFVLKVAKELAELHEKDPKFHKVDGEIIITLFRPQPVIYKFKDQPIIAMANDMWYMRTRTETWEESSPQISLTTKEATILWDLVFEK